MKAAEHPLLFFDSGVGGLSVLDAVRRRLPPAPIIYVADSEAFPYGVRSEADIAARVPALLGRLVERYQPRLAVIACNTASTIALAAVRQALHLPIVGTVPAIKPAASLTKTGVIAVLGTQATVRQPYVDRLVTEFAADCLVLRHGAPGLVELAEIKLMGQPVPPAAVAAAVAGLLAQPGSERLDTVVLACTHFPLLIEDLRLHFPPGTRFVDGAEGIARRVETLTTGQAWPTSPPSGLALFTRFDDQARRLVPALRRYGLSQVGGMA